MQFSQSYSSHFLDCFSPFCSTPRPAQEVIVFINEEWKLITAVFLLTGPADNQLTFSASVVYADRQENKQSTHISGHHQRTLTVCLLSSSSHLSLYHYCWSGLCFFLHLFFEVCQSSHDVLLLSIQFAACNYLFSTVIYILSFRI